MESKYAITSPGLLKPKIRNFNSSPLLPAKRKLENSALNGKANGNDEHKMQKPCFSNPYAKTESATNANRKWSSISNDRKALPVYNCRQRVLKEIEQSDTVLIMGETGSGKTTQIPQFLMEAGYGKCGIIGVTQPRRVAAITIAKRVAQEQACNVGELVGYTVRFEDCTSAKTRIRFLTDGSLLREALSDRLLRSYSVIMLDEAHERTINTDILFGIVKEAQKQRKQQRMTPLKVVITSATMDIDHFSQYFGVKGLYLEGRSYPVRVLHTKDSQDDYINAALVTLFELHRDKPLNHDVLVFLTGQEEIETMAQQIRQIAKLTCSGAPNVRVYPLYAQLPQAKQLECFLPVPPNTRKIVLATNIAETSITIPGIRCVIDCGYVKQKVYNPNCGLDILRAVRISQAQAWQRCGRAGRDSPGVCYRTYTKNEMDFFHNMSTPEILRSNISATVLQLLALGIDCQNFDFLDAPSADALKSAYRTLESLGAIKRKANCQITELGRSMTLYPLDPKYSKLLLSASKFECMEEMLSLVAVLSSENIFVHTADKAELAALAHAKFHSKFGDHLTLLNVFKAFQKTERPKVWCHDNFLNVRNLNYAREVREQLVEITQRLRLPINSCGDNFDAVRKCLLIGLYDNIAELQKDNFYLTISGRQKAKIHPSSILHGKYRPEYILFTEVVLTERIFLRLVTEICPEWIEQVVPSYEHLNRIKK